MNAAIDKRLKCLFPGWNKSSGDAAAAFVLTAGVHLKEVLKLYFSFHMLKVTWQLCRGAAEEAVRSVTGSNKSCRHDVLLSLKTYTHLNQCNIHWMFVLLQQLLCKLNQICTTKSDIFTKTSLHILLKPTKHFSTDTERRGDAELMNTAQHSADKEPDVSLKRRRRRDRRGAKSGVNIGLAFIIPEDSGAVVGQWCRLVMFWT